MSATSVAIAALTNLAAGEPTMNIFQLAPTTATDINNLATTPATLTTITEVSHGVPGMLGSSFSCASVSV